MRTVKLNTGVIVMFNSRDEIISVKSPYYKEYKKTILRTYVDQIKSIIK